MITLTATLTPSSVSPSTVTVGTYHYAGYDRTVYRYTQVVLGCANFTWQTVAGKHNVWVVQYSLLGDTKTVYGSGAMPVAILGGTWATPAYLPGEVGSVAGLAYDLQLSIGATDAVLSFDGTEVATIPDVGCVSDDLGAVCIDAVSGGRIVTDYFIYSGFQYLNVDSTVTTADVHYEIDGVGYGGTADALLKSASQSYSSAALPFTPLAVSPDRPTLGSQQPLLFHGWSLASPKIPRPTVIDATVPSKSDSGFARGVYLFSWFDATCGNEYQLSRIDEEGFEVTAGAAGGGGNVVSLRCGYTALWRGGALWTRPAPNAAWVRGAAVAAADGGLVLPGLTDDRIYALAPAVVASADLGATTGTALAASLPAVVTGWNALGVSLTDARVWCDLLAAGVGLASGAVKVVAETAAAVTGAPSGYPLLFRDDDGRLRVVVVGAGTVADFTSIPDGTVEAWTAGPSASVTGAAVFYSACSASGSDGSHVIAGHDTSASKVTVLSRPSPSESWEAVQLPPSVSGEVGPYVLQLPTGAWEVGWLAPSGAWVQYRAAHPTLAWEVWTP